MIKPIIISVTLHPNERDPIGSIISCCQKSGSELLFLSNVQPIRLLFLSNMQPIHIRWKAGMSMTYWHLKYINYKLGGSSPEFWLADSRSISDRLTTGMTKNVFLLL